MSDAKAAPAGRSAVGRAVVSPRLADGFRQLKRNCPNMVKPLADAGDHGLDLIPGRRGEYEQEAGLAGDSGGLSDQPDSI